MTKTLLIPDIHGDWDAAERLMRSVGALDANYERTPGWKTVALGDLIHGSAATADDDRDALTLVENGAIDLLLLGNHEYGYFGGMPFPGFAHFPDLDERLNDLWLEGRIKVATSHGDKLITHAGLTPRLARRNGPWPTAYEAAQALNERFADNPRHELFSDLGHSRGGWHEQGGILWSDWSEPRWLGDFSQIHGHTFVGPQFHYATNGNFALVLDNGGGKFANRLAGAVLEGTQLEVVRGYKHQPDFLVPLFDLAELDIDGVKEAA